MKKITLSVLAVLFTVGVSFGQLREVDSGGVPNEEQVPDSRMEQHEAFLDGEYRFPAKPRNMWTFGLEGGYDQINGDVDPEFGWDLGLNVRKALGYATSLRFGVNYMRPQGSDAATTPSRLIEGANAKANRFESITGADLNSGPGRDVWIYEHEFEQTALLPYAEVILNLNNINFHREQTDWSFEVGVGPAAYIFQTETTFRDVRESNGSSSLGTFEDINIGNSEDTREDLFGDDDNLNNDGYDIVAAATVSGNIAYRASDRISLSLRPRYVRTWDDWLDGEAYHDTSYGADDAGFSPDKDQNFAMNLGVDFSLGNKDKRVQPLWWENPLNYTYPYLQDEYEFDDEYLFEDSDGDGVVDRMDKEPNSPCAFVDGGGVAIDSDKDGIVDCNDACPFTPAAMIAEIDENGCTPPPVDKHCCDETDELRQRVEELESRPVATVANCASKVYPSITFSSNARRVAASQNGTLAQIAATLSSDPSCRIVVEGFATGRRKVATQVAWARAKAVADTLVDTYGISSDRIIVRYSGVEGYGDVVMVRSARPEEVGTYNPAAPAPGTY